MRAITQRYASYATLSHVCRVSDALFVHSTSVIPELIFDVTDVFTPLR
jgi:hypothetical protein